MSADTNNPIPTPTGERRLLRWILVLQIVILGWLAKNYFDGAFRRRPHNPPAVVTSTDAPPSLEPTRPNAPSPFSVFPRFVVFPRPAPLAHYPHPATRLRAEMEQMLAEANRAFADFDSFFGWDDAWATLPASPALNMRELDDAYEITLSLPDPDPANLDVRLDGRLLSISSHQDTRTPHTSSSQHFSSRHLLPGPAEPNATLQITNDAGRISIRVPKPTGDTAAR